VRSLSWCIAGIAVFAAATRSAEAPATNPSTAIPPTGIHPAAVRCEGRATVERRGSAIVLRHEGATPADTVEYRIDLDHPDVQAGLLRVEETTTGALPLAEAGLTYRFRDGRMAAPVLLRDRGRLVAGRIEPGAGGTVVLEAVDAIDGVAGVTGDEGEHHKRYELSLAGKALRVRMRSLDGRERARGTYAGAYLGPMRGVPQPRDLKIPYMVAYPVTLFAGKGGAAYAGVTLDLHASHGSTWNLRTRTVREDGIAVGDDWIHNTYEVAYLPLTDGSLAAAVDETFYVTVSRSLRDLFPTSGRGASPYHDEMAGRFVINLGGAATGWPAYEALVARLHGLGVRDVFFYVFAHWTGEEAGEGLAAVRGHALGPCWVPGRDDENLRRFTERVVGLGYRIALYTLFEYNRGGPTAFDPSDLAVGVWTEEMERGPVSPSRQMPFAVEENRRIHERYGTNAGQTDVIAGSAPAAYVDLDAAYPDKEKTLRDVIEGNRRILEAISEIHGGPVLSEGSMGPVGTNCELAYAGAVDTVDGIVHTGAGVHASELEATNPFAPVAWPVVPDYALVEENRLLVRNGNGFYDRFFPRGGLAFPLSDEAADLYRIYEITYGHAGFAVVRGSEGEFVREKDLVKDYHLVRAVVREMHASPVASVRYEVGGRLATLDEVLAGAVRAGEAGDAGEGANPLDALRPAVNPLEALRDPRIELRFENGLVVRLNHGAEPWEARIETGERFVLPENGWIAWRPETGFLALSAIPDGFAGRIDSLRDRERRVWLLDGRGRVESFGRMLAGPGGGLAVRDFEHDIQIDEIPGGELLATPLPGGLR